MDSTTLVLNDDGFGQVRIAQLTPTSWWTLDEFTYTTSWGEKIVIPIGFATDGCSTPLRLLIKSWGGHYSQAALTHDYLYSIPYNRKNADLVFLEMMRKAGVDPFVRSAMWIAVRLLGGSIFKYLGVRT